MNETVHGPDGRIDGPDLAALAADAAALRAQIGLAVHGQDDIVDMLLVALFARGHCLLEGPPGTAKTLLAQSLAAALGLDFRRIQFTPDLMPGDVTGTSIFDFASSSFTLVKGPVFTQLLLGDEINRAPPKTQAALLQVMQERRVTIDGEDHRVGDPFMVVATQNPIENQGTYPLPEAQLDRFLFKLVLDFPDEAAELEILRRHAAQPLSHDARHAQLSRVVDEDALRAGQASVDAIRLDRAILAYIVALARATRDDVALSHGASTRAADALAGAVRAAAALAGRDYALPDDVKRLFTATMRHRVVLAPAAEIEGRAVEDVLAAILARTDAPR